LGGYAAVALCKVVDWCVAGLTLVPVSEASRPFGLLRVWAHASVVCGLAWCGFGYCSCSVGGARFFLYGWAVCRLRAALESWAAHQVWAAHDPWAVKRCR
jgi:hypothetical protein